MLQDPAWLPLLRGQPLTAEERAKWIDYLDLRGDLRGEVLRLAEELAAEEQPPEAAAKRARLSELVPQIDDLWWSMARSIPDLLNCGMGRGRDARVRFAFSCPRSWEELAPTDERGVRHCASCGEDVYRADTVIAADDLARRGKCIAVPAQIVEKAGYPDGGRRMMTGRPEHPVPRWARRLFGDGSDR